MSSFKAISLSPSVTAIDEYADNIFTWQVQGGVQRAFRLYIYNNTTDALVYDSGLIVSSKQSHVIVADTLNNGTDYKWYVSTNTLIDAEGDFVSSEYEFFTCSAIPGVSIEYPPFGEINTTRIENFDDKDDWTPIDGTITENTDSYIEFFGTSTIDLYSNNTPTASTPVSSYMTKPVTLDLSVFGNGVVSDDNDYIRLVALCEEEQDHTLYVQFTSAGGYYYYTFNALFWSDVPAFCFDCPKNNFYSSGSPSWDAITEIKVGFINAYKIEYKKTHVYFQAIELYRESTTETVFYNQDNTFYLNYSQAEGIGVKKYKMKLYEHSTPISDTGWLYDLLLKHEFTGLSTNTTYNVEGIITSQYDQEGTTGLKPFTVSYQNSSILKTPTATANNSTGSIDLAWDYYDLSATPIEQVRIKRKASDGSFYVTLGDVANTVKSYTDTTARNNITYTYLLNSIDVDGNEGTGSEITAILDFYGWFLTDGTNIYKFDAQVKSGNITTNRGITIIDTYQQYPTVSFANKNYRSGSFSTIPYSYNAVTGYSFTYALLEELRAFIDNETIKYLKNTKGEIFQVITSKFNYEYMDESAEQIFSISFDWVEVGVGETGL